MNMTQDDLRNASKTSVHDTVKALNAQADESASLPQSALTAADLARLENMSKQQLIALYRLLNADKVHVGLLSKEERIEAAKLKFWASGLNEPDIFKALPALKEAFDRDVGKAAQTVNMTVEEKGLGRLTTERLLALDAELCRRAGLEPLNIAPMPGRLSEL